MSTPPPTLAEVVAALRRLYAETKRYALAKDIGHEGSELLEVMSAADSIMSRYDSAQSGVN